jgi:hypothetical protein
MQMVTIQRPLIRAATLIAMLIALPVILNSSLAVEAMAAMQEEEVCSGISVCDEEFEDCEEVTGLDLTWEEGEPGGEAAYCNSGEQDLSCRQSQITSCDYVLCKPGKKVFGCTQISFTLSVPLALTLTCGWEPGPEECHTAYVPSYEKKVIE